MAASTPTRAAPAFLLGLAILAVTHAAAYLALTGDAREGLTRIEETHDVGALAAARDPGTAPYAGTPEYGPWLASYERWHAAGEHATHARHEGLMRGGMILSFLIGLGLLVTGLLRVARTPRRRAGDRPAHVRAHPAPEAAVAPAPAALRPVPVRARRLRRSA